jgi:uncharacterized integral membrane protein
MSSESPVQRPEAADNLTTQKRRSLAPKQIASGGLVVVAAVFALLNLQDVPMHWIVGTTHTPLIVLVAACVLIGMAVGFVVGRRQRTPSQTPSKH